MKILEILKNLTAAQRDNINNIWDYFPAGEVDVSLNVGISDNEDYGIWDASIRLEAEHFEVQGYMGPSGYGAQFKVRMDYDGNFVSYERVGTNQARATDQQVTDFETLIPQFKCFGAYVGCVNGFESQATELFGEDLAYYC